MKKKNQKHHVRFVSGCAIDSFVSYGAGYTLSRFDVYFTVDVDNRSFIAEAFKGEEDPGLFDEAVDVLQLSRKLDEWMAKTSKSQATYQASMREYRGTFNFRTGDTRNPISISLGSGTSGTWTTCGQTAAITVHEAGDSLVFSDGQTVMRGTASGEGIVEGEVIQDGVSGGHFKLVVDSKAMSSLSLLKTVLNPKRLSGKDLWATATAMIVLLFIPEYGTCPLFIYLGYVASLKLASLLQVIFCAFSCFAQLKMVHLFDYNWMYFGTARPGLTVKKKDEVQTLLGVNLPKRGIHISKRKFLAFTLIPNYAHVHATCVFAGVAARRWGPVLQNRFLHTWEYAPLVGETIGSWSMPHILMGLLVYSMLMHGVALRASYVNFKGRMVKAVPLMADAANLLHIGAVAEYDEGAGMGNNKLTRWTMAILVKGVFLWAKTSLLAVEFDDMSEIEIAQATVSVLLAWNTLLPLTSLFFFWWHFEKARTDCIALYSGEKLNNLFPRKMRFGLPFLLLCTLCLFLKEGAHFVGVFACTSHDFSLVHGCTQLHP